MPTSAAPTTPSANARRISLTIILGAAAVDAVFLVALVVALAAGGGGAVTVLAALFVFGWVYLLYLAAKGAMDGRWGWSYFGLVAITLGPLGAILGARRMRAEIDAAEAEPPAARGTRKEQRRTAAEQRRARR